jgi:hypothetical protein
MTQKLITNTMLKTSTKTELRSLLKMARLVEFDEGE